MYSPTRLALAPMASWRPALTLKTVMYVLRSPDRHLTWQQPSLLSGLDGCLIWLAIVIFEEGPGGVLLQCARQYCSTQSTRGSRDCVCVQSWARKGQATGTVCTQVVYRGNA
jgi:hypothetical protein